MASTIHRSLVLLALLGSVSFGQPAAAQDVDRTFDQGAAALKAGKYEEAVRAFEGVWKERKTHDVAANLALAEAQLGRHRDAAEHFAFALRNFPVTGSQGVRKGIADALALSKARVATLRITVSADGAEVLVDGHTVGRSPMADEIFLEPGAHTLEAHLTGYTTSSKTLDAKAGSSETMQLTLAPVASPSSTMTAPPPPRSLVPAFVMGGVGAASLIAGGVLLGVGFAKRSDVLSQQPRNADGKPVCYQFPPPSGPDTLPGCAAFRATASEGAGLANAGIVVLGIGGIAAAATVAYILWPHGSASSEPRKAMLRLAPVVSATGAGLSWSGAF